VARRSDGLPPYRAQLALLVDEAPAGDAWAHEVKYDGYRIGCAVEEGRATLWSRRGKDWTREFPEVAAAARALPVRSALLDGEVAVLLPDGRTSFQALQNALTGRDRRLVYFVFDLLHLDGEDLAPRPLEERKAALERLVGGRGGIIRYAPHVVGDGAAVFREACRLGLEGIVSKRRSDAYRPGRHAGWVKVKCVLRQELVVGGFTEPEGAARDGIGALLIGFHEGGALRFAGKVGSGFTNAGARALRARLAKLETRESPFTPRPPGWLGKNAHWVRPELVCEVAFTEWTSDGKVRHPSFQGLREDKRPEEVVRERISRLPGAASPAPSPRPSPPAGAGGEGDPGSRAPFELSVAGAKRRGSRRAPTATATPTSPRRSRSAADEVAGVRITSPDRIVFPDLGATKLDLARYYDAVADAMLPHLAGRPLTLFHCPDGVSGPCRFMKHSRVWAPAAVRRVRIPEKTKVGEYLVVDTREALLSVVQMDVVELHTWNSTVDRLEEPDRIVLDLDPGSAVPFAEVVRAARLVRDALAALGLGAFVKTTGGAGLHVVVPLAPARSWQECLAFARALATAIARHDPLRFTVSFAKAGRERKILLDYLRNNRTNTSVAAFSARARPGAPVSVPLAWDELGARLRPERHTIATVPRRLARLREDPWRGWEAGHRPLDRAQVEAVLGFGATP
jgi:bifunctional non-homologous end joining protein LigD